MNFLNQIKSQKDIWELMLELFPIHRTLSSNGFLRSLEIIKSRLDINILEYPSGQEVWDWVIPNEWDVIEAYIEDERGKRLVDFSENNLHLSAYSCAFSGDVTRDELFKHLKYLQDQPDAIPYNYLYYKQGWEFNIAFNKLTEFTSDKYRVHINVNDRPGVLRVGELFLPGESSKEIWISTYLCHPSMANDNLSGVVTAVEVFKQLQQIENRYYSYRLLILPETVGAVTYLAYHEDFLSNVLGGYTVYVCGDPGNLTYKKSYQENSLVNQAAIHILKHHNKAKFRVRDYDAGGSDERQYNAPGVRLPFGGLTRTPAGEFIQYHTSHDNLSAVGAKYLCDTADVLFQTLQVIDANRVYINKYKGEPFFTKYNISYPSHHEDKNNRNRYYVKILAHEIDGKNSLLDIAEKHNIPMPDLMALAKEFLVKGLIAYNDINS